MPEPELIPLPPFGVWRRAFGDQWTTPELRDIVSTWSALFVDRHNWIERFEVIERIASNGIGVLIPRNPRWQLPQALGAYRQRTGERHLVLRFHRPSNGVRFAEASIAFEPDGADTPVEMLATLLDVARRAIEAQV